MQAARDSLGFFRDPDGVWRARVEVMARESALMDSLGPLRGHGGGKRKGLSELRPAQEFIQTRWVPVLHCATAERLGAAGDGGKWLCNPLRVAERGPSCLVYSIGSRNDFTFEAHLHAMLPRCEIHTFDPTIGAAPSNTPPFVHFHAWGLLAAAAPEARSPTIEPGKGSRRLHYTLREMAAQLGHSHREIDVLKVDCDGCEHEALRAWAMEGVPLVRQLLVEVHFGSHPREAMHADIRSANRLMWLLRTLGFVVFAKEPNVLMSSAYGAAAEYSLLRLATDPGPDHVGAARWADCTADGLRVGHARRAVWPVHAWVRTAEPVGAGGEVGRHRGGGWHRLRLLRAALEREMLWRGTSLIQAVPAASALPTVARSSHFCRSQLAAAANRSRPGCSPQSPLCCIRAWWTQPWEVRTRGDVPTLQHTDACVHIDVYSAARSVQRGPGYCWLSPANWMSTMRVLRLVSRWHQPPRTGSAGVRREEPRQLPAGMVLLLEDDALPVPGWRSRYIRFLRDNPPCSWDLAVLSGKRPGPMQGTSAVLMHSSDAARFWDFLASNPVGSIDVLLFGSGLRWGRPPRVVVSDLPLFRPPENGTSTTEAILRQRRRQAPNASAAAPPAADPPPAEEHPPQPLQPLPTISALVIARASGDLLLAEAVVAAYTRAWPNNPFVWHVPYSPAGTHPTRRLCGDGSGTLDAAVVCVPAPADLHGTVTALLRAATLARDDLIFYASDDYVPTFVVSPQELDAVASFVLRLADESRNFDGLALAYTNGIWEFGGTPTRIPEFAGKPVLHLDDSEVDEPFVIGSSNISAGRVVRRPKVNAYLWCHGFWRARVLWHLYLESHSAAKDYEQDATNRFPLWFARGAGNPFLMRVRTPVASFRETTHGGKLSAHFVREAGASLVGPAFEARPDVVTDAPAAWSGSPNDSGLGLY